MTQPGEALRDILRANLFDGDEGGTVTMPIAQLLTDIVDIIEEHALAAPVAGEGLREAAELAMETIGWTQGFLVDEPNVYETWFRGVNPAMTALRAALAASQPVAEEEPRPTHEDIESMVAYTDLAIEESAPGLPHSIEEDGYKS